MQIHLAGPSKQSTKNSSLFKVANDAILSSAQIAIHNRNYVVNNISADLRIETNGLIVSSVLNKLFNTVVRNAQNSVILVSAKEYGLTILVQVKSKGLISPGLSEEISHACINAQKTGGIIEMTQCESEQASVAYCFLNVAAA